MIYEKILQKCKDESSNKMYFYIWSLFFIYIGGVSGNREKKTIIFHLNRTEKEKEAWLVKKQNYSIVMNV